MRSEVSFSDPTLCTQKWRLDSLFLLPFYVFCVFFVVVAAAVIAAAVAGATRRPRLTVPTWGKPGK